MRGPDMHIMALWKYEKLLYCNVCDIETLLISGVQQSESVIHIHASIAFQILFPLR